MTNIIPKFSSFFIALLNESLCFSSLQSIAIPFKLRTWLYFDFKIENYSVLDSILSCLFTHLLGKKPVCIKAKKVIKQFLRKCNYILWFACHILKHYIVLFSITFQILYCSIYFIGILSFEIKLFTFIEHTITQRSKPFSRRIGQF